MKRTLDSNESASKLPTMNDHFNTLWALFDAASAKAEKLGIKSEELENYMHTGGVNVGQSFKRSFAIDSLKGRNTRKGFHITVFRLEETYELVSYVL